MVGFPRDKVAIISVFHILPDIYEFWSFLDKTCERISIILKLKSIDQTVVEKLANYRLDFFKSDVVGNY